MYRFNFLRGVKQKGVLYGMGVRADLFVVDVKVARDIVLHFSMMIEHMRDFDDGRCER
jgi:hypothetical protein